MSKAPLRYYATTVRLDGDECDGCDRLLVPGERVLASTHGNVYCDRDCADDHDARRVRGKA